MTKKQQKYTKAIVSKENEVISSQQRAQENRAKKDLALRQTLLATISKQVRRKERKSALVENVCEVRSKSSLFEAATLMAAHQQDILLVYDEEKDMLVGMIGMLEMRAAMADGMDPKRVTVQEVMRETPFTAQIDASEAQIIESMIKHRQPLVIVLDADEVITSVRLQSILPVPDDPDITVADLFNDAIEPPVLVVLSQRDTVAEACKRMQKEQTECALVLDDQPGGHVNMKGLVTIRMLVLRVLSQGLDARTTTVIRVITPNPLSVTSDHNLRDAIHLMNSSEEGCLLVKDPFNESIAGILDPYVIASSFSASFPDAVFEEEFFVERDEPPNFDHRISYADSRDDLSVDAEYGHFEEPAIVPEVQPEIQPLEKKRSNFWRYSVVTLATATLITASIIFYRRRQALGHQ